MPASGAVGFVMVTGSASDTDGLAPATGISGANVDCTGIAVDPHPNSGCSTGLGAQAALVLQPGQSGTAKQEFRITGPGTVTITVGGPQTVQVTYTGSNVPTPTTTTTAEPAGGGCSVSTNQWFHGRRLASAAALNEVHVVSVCPDVQFHKGGTPADAWLPVEKNTVLKQGDEITCDPDGAVVLGFADNSTVVVRNTTQLKIASFFTEGGVVRTEVLLKMGEVAAQVNKSAATKSDFKIKEPTATDSVRGGVLTRNGTTSTVAVDGASVAPGARVSVFYDPTSRTSIWDVYAGEMDVTPVGRPTVALRPGQELAATGTSVSGVAPIGKAGARGGINARKALELVENTIGPNRQPCGLVTPRTPVFSVKPAPTGWLVSVKAVAGKAKGLSTWLAAGSTVTPRNAAAKKIASGCRTR